MRAERGKMEDILIRQWNRDGKGQTEQCMINAGMKANMKNFQKDPNGKGKTQASAGKSKLEFGPLDDSPIPFSFGTSRQQ
jgi:hypothetical protein